MAENIPVRKRRDALPPPAIEIIPKAPKHLSKEQRKLFNEITSEWTIGPDGLAILQGALEARDSYEECRRVVARDGPTFRTQTGRIAANPACKLANDYLREFRLGMKQLGLDPEK